MVFPSLSTNVIGEVVRISESSLLSEDFVEAFSSVSEESESPPDF